MEPVISFDHEHAAHEGVPEDAESHPARFSPTGDPGYAGVPPRRPHGKRATDEAGMLGAEAEETEAAARARHEEMRQDRGGQGAGASGRRANSTVGPFKDREVGDSRQAEDPDVPSAFEPTEEENEKKK
jgi:peptide/nickel transport system ATP-binding protein